MRSIPSLLIMIMFIKVSFCQKSTAFEYRVNYKSNGDSTVELVGKMYYNSGNKILKNVTIGPLQKDSCYTIYRYNAKGKVDKEQARCSDGSTVGLISFEFRFAKNGALNEEKRIQEKPYFEIGVKKYFKDSLIELQYSSIEAELFKNFDYKNIHIVDKRGRTSAWISLNKNGDTLVYKKFMFLPIGDTAKVHSKIDRFVESVSYLDSSNSEVRVDYYANSKVVGSWFKDYNSKKKIILERFFDLLKNSKTIEIEYFYDSSGNVFKKIESDRLSALTKVYFYATGKIRRVDYYYDSRLDHATVFKYRPY